MRKLRILIVIMLISFTASAKLQTMYVGQYDLNQPKTIVIESPFGKPDLMNLKDLEQLKGKHIHHIDLVYTSYRLEDHFDQNGLNAQRIHNIKKCLPQIEADKPSWMLVAQTDAQTLNKAQKAFHGFVIYYSEGLEFQFLSSFFEPFHKNNRVFEASNKGGHFRYNSGTTIHLPKDAVVYANGHLVNGPFQLIYKEYRNQADMAYSGIPMIYNANGLSYNFSSAGMYEIRAYQHGQELKLRKPISVDFNTTGYDKGVGFYQMDDETGEWDRLKQDVFETRSEDCPVDKPKGVIRAEPERKQDRYILKHLNWKQHRSYWMQSELWTATEEKLADFKGLSKMHVSHTRDSLVKIIITSRDIVDFEKALRRGLISLVGDKAAEEINQLPRNVGSLLAENADKGHTYPCLVKGLNSEKFGVYNCDQIYRIGEPKIVKPIYVDASTGEEIGDRFVTCVLDLNYNGSFSFDPRNVMFNMEGKNVILLFTKDRKTYMLNSDEFAQTDISNTTTPTFKMTDMTEQLKSSEDLSRLLNI